MDIVDRYKMVIRYAIGMGIVSNQKEYGQYIGYTNASAFSQIINNKAVVPKDFNVRFASVVPNLSLVWLLTGEGEMLIKDGSVEQNNIVGDNINGHNVTVGKSGDDYMKVIMQQSLQLSKSQEQIDRLITLLEKMSDKKE